MDIESDSSRPATTLHGKKSIDVDPIPIQPSPPLPPQRIVMACQVVGLDIHDLSTETVFAKYQMLMSVSDPSNFYVHII